MINTIIKYSKSLILDIIYGIGYMLYIMSIPIGIIFIQFGILCNNKILSISFLIIGVAIISGIIIHIYTIIRDANNVTETIMSPSQSVTIVIDELDAGDYLKKIDNN